MKIAQLFYLLLIDNLINLLKKLIIIWLKNLQYIYNLYENLRENLVPICSVKLNWFLTKLVYFEKKSLFLSLGY